MNEALDELVLDYAVYYMERVGEMAIGTGLTFTEWCNDPVLCDQELLAQTTVSRDTRERLVPAGEPISPVGTESPGVEWIVWPAS